MARHRRHRRRPRPARDPGRDPAARQAQADLRAARRHRRLRHHHQRRQGRPDRQQARAEDRLPPLRLPGRPEGHVLRRPAREAPRAGRREGRRGHAPHNTLGRQMLTKLKVYAGPEHPHAAQQPVPFEITQVAQ